MEANSRRFQVLSKAAGEPSGGNVEKISTNHRNSKFIPSSFII